MPVRKIPKSYQAITGQHYSHQSHRSVQYESSLERDLLIRLDGDHRVKSYEEQPVEIPFTDRRGKKHHYTPDLLIVFHPEFEKPPELCEVKYVEDFFKLWKEKDLKYRLKAGRKYAKEKGWKFRIHTEKTIRVRSDGSIPPPGEPFHYLDNLFLLNEYRENRFEPEKTNQVLDALSQLSRTSVDKLMSHFSSDNEEKAYWLLHIWHLIANRQIGFDPDKKLTRYSEIWAM